jgi:hypothetical protein
LLHATHAAFAKSISLAFLASKLVQGAVERRLPWGIGGARLRLPRGRINTSCSVCRFDPERKFPLTPGTGLESQADFIKPCLDEDTYGLKHQQKAGETRKSRCPFSWLDCANICAGAGAYLCGDPIVFSDACCSINASMKARSTAVA